MLKEKPSLGFSAEELPATCDEFDIFGKYVASELRSFKDKRYSSVLLDAKHEINNVIYQAQKQKNTLDGL